ncbi:hypothetical protein CLV98_11747 [Dyadobacter jejuensis]|uniref:Uncharacterized protein n=1 Tax=Dyadobacter jejuensis TaxID=1082580 RepID=A0A316AAS6_9BACT|nr:hypothetical protein [Dyadobacter jejuensis]PWJ54509.1 hypothetical protein CLV98_11747 [Dyadobacter jejuensis]
MKNFLIIFITLAFLCCYTGIDKLLLAKSQVVVVCDAEECESETVETQQLMEDHHIIAHFFEGFPHLFNINNNFSPFLYRISFNNEVYRNLFSPPPELS